MADNQHIVVFVTAKDRDEAKVIAHQLVSDHLVACVNIVDDVESIYWWDNQIEESKEVLLIIKSRKDQFSKIAEKVKFVHSYDTPEVIALPIIDGDDGYLKWIDASVRN